MNDKLNVFVDEKYSTLLEAIEEYAIFRVKDQRLTSVINQGLTVFSKFPHVMFASLYLMNDSTFEFDHNETIEEIYVKDSKVIFNSLVEKGSVGKTLQSGILTFEKCESSKNMHKNFVIIPLMQSSGVLGIVILSVEIDLKEMDQFFFIAANLLSNLFSTTLENAKLLQNQIQTQEMMDQVIASRTLRLVESKKQLAEKFEDLRSHISMSIPHEVRTPINQILGFTDFLINHFNEASYEDAKEMLTDIKTSANRLRRLFENYLFYANLSIISTNVNEIQKLQNNVTYTAKQLLEDVAISCVNNNDRAEDLKLEINEDASLLISEEYLRKIIEEIMDNAIKYSRKGTDIVVKTEIADDLYNITIIDYGRGMTNEQVENLDAYVQFERKVYEQQGSGLGMAIVTRVIDLHNGHFEIQSKIGEYTKVSITFPAVKNPEFDL